MGQAKIYGQAADGYTTTALGPYTTGQIMAIGAPSSQAQDQDMSEYHGFMFFDATDVSRVEGGPIPVDAKIYEAKLGYYIDLLEGDIRALYLDFYACQGCIGSKLNTSDYKVVMNNGKKFGRNSKLTTGSKSLQWNSTALDMINPAGITNIEIDAYWTGPINTNCMAWLRTEEYGGLNRPYLEIKWAERIPYEYFKPS
jgi:hypothetical protein